LFNGIIARRERRLKDFGGRAGEIERKRKDGLQRRDEEQIRALWKLLRVLDRLIRIY